MAFHSGYIHIYQLARSFGDDREIYDFVTAGMPGIVG